MSIRLIQGRKNKYLVIHCSAAGTHVKGFANKREAAKYSSTCDGYDIRIVSQSGKVVTGQSMPATIQERKAA